MVALEFHRSRHPAAGRLPTRLPGRGPDAAPGGAAVRAKALADPITTNAANVTGFLNMLVAARDASAKRFLYPADRAAPMATTLASPMVEDTIGKPLSPYAVTRFVNEL